MRDTVDKRLLDMQADKVKTIDLALQDTGRASDPLTMKDLASLFGHLSQDSNGNLRVDRDYEEDDDEDDDEVEHGNDAFVID